MRHLHAASQNRDPVAVEKAGPALQRTASRRATRGAASRERIHFPKEKSRLAAGFSFSLTLPHISSELAVLLALPALAVRILLLLARLLAAALLLAGLLTRVLILLARVLVLVRHFRISLLACWNATPG
jgi:hypothetical protein